MLPFWSLSKILKIWSTNTWKRRIWKPRFCHPSINDTSSFGKITKSNNLQIYRGVASRQDQRVDLENSCLSLWSKRSCWAFVSFTNKAKICTFRVLGYQGTKVSKMLWDSKNAFGFDTVDFVDTIETGDMVDIVGTVDTVEAIWISAWL